MKPSPTRSSRLAGAAQFDAMPEVAAPSTPEPRPWYLSTIGLALLGSLLMWAAFPPLDVGMLAWVAPVCWLVLVRREHLDGRHPYRNILLAGFVFWLAALSWLTLPHWATSVGWVALSAYLAIYVALFIGLSRVAVHRFHVPTIVAAPIIWTGLELVRAHLLSGFLMASLAHTQYRWTAIIQISDLAGAYGVSFLVMLVAACVARMLPIERHRIAVWPLLPVVAAMTAALLYGSWRMQSPAGKPAPKIALVQGNVETVFGGDLDEQKKQIETQYKEISKRALAEHPEIELLVWPESMYWEPNMVIDEGAWLPAEMFASHPRVDQAEAKSWEENRILPPGISAGLEKSQRELLKIVCDLGNTRVDERILGLFIKGKLVEPVGPPLLLGMDTERYVPGGLRRYSSSVLVDRCAGVVGCYNKMHPVAFGEYMPFGEYFPAIYALTPLPGGLSVGDGPRVFQVGDARVAPNICYETVMPHLIRDQVATLRAAGTEPDLLVTQTNDGWFRGSSALDMHMVCSVFRAVECRKPMFVAANTGISAVIDANGEIRSRLGRGEQGYLLTEMHLDGRVSPYVRFGDTLGLACAGACGLLLVVGGVDRLRRKSAAGATV